MEVIAIYWVKIEGTILQLFTEIKLCFLLQQFMLGNYSFQIKAFDPTNNTIQEGYKFAKPIKISMFYDVDNLVNANKRVVNKDVKKDDIDPVLYLWDLKNKTWYVIVIIVNRV